MPKGKSTTGIGISVIFFEVFSDQGGISSNDLEFTGHPSTEFIGGNKLAKPLTAVDFPVPRSPKTNTPPILGSIAVIIIASFISSWPTMAANGKVLLINFFPVSFD